MKNNKDINPNSRFSDENNNLGLDADHSSDGDTAASKWNDDNDRISGNSEGESDDSDNNSSAIHSPLDDK